MLSNIKIIWPCCQGSWNESIVFIWSLRPEKDTRYKLRIISVHKGQGGGFKEQETKKKGIKRGRKDEAHYYDYLWNFVSSKWYKLDDNDVDDVEENDMLLDVRDKAYMLHYICYG